MDEGRRMMPRPARDGRVWGAVALGGQTLKGLATMVFFLSIPAPLFDFSPPVAALGLLMIAAVFLAWQLLLVPVDTRRLRWATRGSLSWSMASLLLCAVPLIWVFDLTLVEMYRWVVDVPSSGAGMREYAAQPMGWLPVTLLVVGLGPLVEEFVFRGMMQGTAERHFGNVLGIALPAFLFALVHGQMERVPYYFLWGCLFGYAVRLTGSVWSGVLLHAGSNLLVDAIRVSGIPSPVVAHWVAATGTWIVPVLALASALGVVAIGWEVRKRVRWAAG
jgi:membrane protease YdiL (CAAX protease family)